MDEKYFDEKIFDEKIEEIFKSYPFYSKNRINTFFNNNDVWFRKSLGQNFLIDKNIIRKIYNTLIEYKKDYKNFKIIEIGGGLGNISIILSNLCKNLFIIEIDKFYSSILKNIFEKNINSYDCNIKIIDKDLFDVDFENEIFKNNLTNENFIIFGAIPYNISSKIIELISKLKNNILLSFLIVQKEYYERIDIFNRISNINRRKNKEDKPSYLTIFVNYHFEINKLFHISKNSFYPIPKVDSTAFILKPKKSLLNKEDEKKFFEFVSFCFSNKRKLILNSIKNYLIINKIDIDINHILKRKELENIKNWSSSRAEDLILNEWIELFKIISKII